MQMCPTNYTKVLLQWIDPENLPEYLGGTSKATLLDDAGPWQDPKLIAEVRQCSQLLGFTCSESSMAPGWCLYEASI